MFLDNDCQACHSVTALGIDGGQLAIDGGDLSTIGDELKDAEWLKSYLSARERGASGLEHDQMPLAGGVVEGLPQQRELSDEDLDVLADWLVTLKNPRLRPVNLFVRGRAGVVELPKNERKALEKQLKEEKKRAEKARKDLEKQLAGEFGKKMASWPPEAMQRYEAATQDVSATDRALADFDYESSTQENVDDSVQDLREAVTGEAQRAILWDRLGRKHLPAELEKIRLLRLVDDPELAELTVEVRARRTCRASDYSFWGALKASVVQVRNEAPCENALVLAFTPAAHIDGESISPADLERYSNFERYSPTVERRIVRVTHAYERQEPYWTIELVRWPATSGSGQFFGGYKGLAVSAASLLGEFVRDHNGTLAHY